MDTSFTSSPLLGRNDSFEEQPFCNGGLEDSYVSESSSGYDSSDVSDVDCDVLTEPRATYKAPRDHVTVSVKFRSTGTLCEDLRLLCDVAEMCDVTFLVGNEGTPVHGVRAILATRSKVFYQLILKQIQIRQLLHQKARKLHGTKAATMSKTSLTDRLTIPVSKYDAEVFRMLIQFVHSGSVAISDSTVVGLLCGAVQFQLTDLAHACWGYISDLLSSSGCGAVLLETARIYSRHHSAGRDIVDKVRSTLAERRQSTRRLESTV